MESFLHTCLHTSNPCGIFSIITKLSQGQYVYHSLFLHDEGAKWGGWVLFVLRLSGYGFSPKVFHFLASDEKRVGEFFMGELV